VLSIVQQITLFVLVVIVILQGVSLSKMNKDIESCREHIQCLYAKTSNLRIDADTSKRLMGQVCRDLSDVLKELSQ